MSTITKEQLIRRAHLTVSRGARELEKHPDRDGVAADIKIASIAARALMAEPIYQLWDEGYYDTEKETYDAALKAGVRGRIVYAAPPAPVSVPDEATPDNIQMLASTYAPRGVTYQWDSDECNAAADSWNACRAAMLQGAEPVSNRDELPDGWVACSERMPNDKDYVWCWGRVVGWTEDDGFEAYYDATRNKWWAVTMDGEEPVRKVTHWQPLPSPPDK